jgi:hypothetical protein
MRWSAILLGTVSLAVPKWAEAQVPAASLQPPPHCSLTCRRQFAQEELLTNPQAFSAAQHELSRVSTEDAYQGRFRSAVDRYEAEEKKLAGQMSALKEERVVKETAFALKDDLPMSDVLPTSFISTVELQEIDNAITKIEARGQSLATDIFGAAANEMVSINAQIVQIARERPWNEAHAIIFGSDGTGGLFGDTAVGSKLDPAARAEIANLKSDVLRDQLIGVSGRVARNEQELRALAKDYMEFKANVTKFAVESKAQIAALQEGQRSLTAAYNQMAGWVGENSYRIDALEGVMWGTLTANQRVEALKGGAFASVLRGRSAQEVAEFKANLKRAAVLEDISNTAGAVGTVANSFASIGRAIGIDLSEPVARINQGVVLAQSIVGIASGNPIGIISGLGGIASVFGPAGGPDATSAALKALRQEIQQLRQEMYQYHVREMEAIEALSGKLDQRFAQLASLQSSTLAQIGFNTLQLDELLKARLNACINLRSHWAVEPRETLDARAERINMSVLYLFPNCREGIQERFYQTNPNGTAVISTIFSLRSLSGGSGELATQVLGVHRYQNETLRPSVTYLFREHGFQTDLAACSPTNLVFTALLWAPRRHGDLVNRASQVQADCRAGQDARYRTVDGTIYDIQEVLKTPISVSNVLFYGRGLYDAMALYEFMDSPGGISPHVMSTAEMTAVPRTGMRAQIAARHLEKVLELVNLSIAQLNVLGGDLVLETLAKDIEAALDDPAKRVLSGIPAARWSDCSAAGHPGARYFNALCFLKRNGVARFNFVRYWTRTRMDNPATTPQRRYSIGMTEADPFVITESFNRSMPLARCADTWCYKLPGANIVDPDPSPAEGTGTLATEFDLNGDFLLPLPAWEEVATDRQAVASKQMDDLLVLRRDLIDRISDFKGSSKLTPDEARLAYAAVVVHAAERGKVAASESQ